MDEVFCGFEEEKSVIMGKPNCKTTVLVSHDREKRQAHQLSSLEGLRLKTCLLGGPVLD